MFRMKRAIAPVFIFFLVPLGLLLAQQAASPPSSDRMVEAEQRLQLAGTSEDYPVTPGDQYRLSYRQGDSPISLSIIVQNDWTVSLGVFGSVDASGMSFRQLKATVEKLLLAGYPRSMPSLTPVALGVFRILVKGEVQRVSYVVAWGLSRVSDILDNVSAPAASMRNVELVSRDGSSRICDLFKATREGLLEENPYVKPGNTIVLSRSERRIQLVGEVREPGNYELLPEEQLNELLETYGGGLLSSADSTRIRIAGVTDKRAVTRRISLQAEGAGGSVLSDGDVVTVPAMAERLPVVSFEGAILAPTETKEAETPASSAEARKKPVDEYGRILYSFRNGETLSDALATIRGSLSPLADLASASIIREGSSDPLYVDMQALLATTGSPTDLPLVPNDRIIIPESKFVVYVSGAVAEPGIYPYAPNRTFQYYVVLAGGSDQENLGSISIFDRKGAFRHPESMIQSEDRIHVEPATITVQGSVFLPGSFPFRYHSPPSYYIGLAGGNDPERNARGSYNVFDQNGKAKRTTDPLSPGDRIYVPSTNLIYSLNKYAPLIATVVTTVWTILLIRDQFAK